MSITRVTYVVLLLCVLAAQGQHAQTPAFRLEEATIADVHRGIQTGQLSCRALVQAYIARARAYNGSCNQLVTEANVGQVLPDYAEYETAVAATASLAPGDPRKTPPIEFGRMEPTASDPSVQQQFGMTVGIPRAKQLRALGMLNIRGERSVTCKGAFDRHPSEGPLPADAPKACEEFRQQPDAVERASALDAQFGRNPDLVAMPMYCVPFSFKDPYDTMDMRSTGGADARYDVDFPARDQTLVAELRSKGAIIYAKANTTEYNGRAGNPGGPNVPEKVLPSTLGYQRSTWAGNPCEVYDTTRAASIGSSSGSGVSVGANLAMCSLCEETGQSCRGPANHNAVALILPQKAMLSFHGGAIGSNLYNDRAGIHCRNVVDSVKVLDALKNPVNGYYDSRDIFTTVSRATVSREPYANAITPGTPGALRGMRIGIIREFMVKHAMVDEPIVDAAAVEMKAMLGGHLGATLVESVPIGWVDDPDIENMTTSFDHAIAQLTPVLFPQLLYSLNAAGEPEFPAFAKKIVPTEFAPGVVHGGGTMQPVDWMLRWAEGLEPAPPNLNLRSVVSAASGQARTFRFHMTQYLARRAKDWEARGITETLIDFPTLNARSKFWGDDQRAAFKNWESLGDLRNGFGDRQSIAEMVQQRELLNRVLVKVVQENKLDVLVQLHSALPPGKIGGAPEPNLNDRAISYPLGAERGDYGDPHSGRLRPRSVRPGIRAHHGPERQEGLPFEDKHDSDAAARARVAVLDQFSGRAGHGAPVAQGGDGLSVGVEATRTATRLRSRNGRALMARILAFRISPFQESRAERRSSMNTITTSSIGVPPFGGAESAYRGPCRILGAHITRVTRGGADLVFCTEYCDGVCQLRKAELESLAPGLSDGVALGEIRCIMLSA